MREKWRVLKRFWKYASLLLFILITFSYAMFQGGFVSWFLFYSFLPFAIYGLALMLYSLNEFEVARIMPKSDFTAGEMLCVTIKLKRRSFFPLFYLIVEDHLAAAIDDSVQRKAKILLFPWFKKEIAYHYTIAHLPRGEHSFGSYLLKIGDPLGLIEKEKSFAARNKIIVYPAYTDLFYQQFENHFDQGMAVSRERVQRDTSMAVGLRDYQPGDRFSWINWKASAKRNEMMTKEFEQRQSNDMLIMMDCSTELHFEAVVSFTASLVRSILKKGTQTGFLTVAKERTFFPIRGGEGQLQAIFYHLAKIQPEKIPPLEKALESEKKMQQQALSLVLVTSRLTRALIEKASLLDRRSGAVSIFFMKGEKERPTQADIALKSMASQRGVRVIFLHEGKEAAEVSEVSFR